MRYTCTSIKIAAVDYVLQRALTVADNDQKELLVTKIRPQLVSMRRYSSAYSKHLVSSKPHLSRV